MLGVFMWHEGELMKVFSSGLGILKDWRILGLLKGYMYEGERMGSYQVGQLRKK